VQRRDGLAPRRDGHLHAGLRVDEDAGVEVDLGAVLGGLLRASRFIVPDELPQLVDDHARGLGAANAEVFVVDVDQRWLVPLPRPGVVDPDVLSIDGTLAGRCFRSMEVMESAEGERRAVWVPVVDGTERLGALHLVLEDEHAATDEIIAFSGLVAELLITKNAYGDFFEVARRREPLSVTAELLWQLLPPLTYGTDQMVISCVFVPTTDIGGDAFDYGVDGSTARLGIFDAVGHDLGAGVLATAAVAAFKNARRSGLDLLPTMRHIDGAIAAHFTDARFVTGIVCSLDVGSGRFRWSVAGHPPPLLLRHGRVVKELEAEPGLPFGLGWSADLAEEQLEAGDRILLYTDGVTEARSASGEPFGLDALADLVSRGAKELPPPETMRLLMHAIEGHNAGAMRDDATAVMLEWRGAGPEHLKV
jgi:serine phosphatase RsbU (regulator of sigma subunit)